jgi:hypothetical protein
LIGAIAATVGVFLPSFLIVVGVVPYFDRLRNSIYFSRSGGDASTWHYGCAFPVRVVGGRCRVIDRARTNELVLVRHDRGDLPCARRYCRLRPWTAARSGVPGATRTLARLHSRAPGSGRAALSAMGRIMRAPQSLAYFFFEFGGELVGWRRPLSASLFCLSLSWAA